MDSVRSGKSLRAGLPAQMRAGLPLRAPALAGPKSGTRRGVAQRSELDAGVGDCCRKYALAEKGPGASPAPLFASCFEPGSVSSPLYLMCGDDTGGRCGNARRVAGKSDASDLEADDAEARPALVPP